MLSQCSWILFFGTLHQSVIKLTKKVTEHEKQKVERAPEATRKIAKKQVKAVA